MYMQRKTALIPKDITLNKEGIIDDFGLNRCRHKLGAINGLCIMCGRPNQNQMKYNNELKRMLLKGEY